MQQSPQYNKHDKQKKKQKEGGSNSIGFLIFALVVGSQFVIPLLQQFSQASGINTFQQLINSLSSFLPMIIVGLVVLSLVLPIIIGVFRTLGGLTEGDAPLSSGGMPSTMNDLTRQADQIAARASARIGSSGLPESMQTLTQMSGPGGSSLPRPTGISDQRLHAAKGYQGRETYQTPGVEPIISGKVLAYGILGALLFVGGGALAFWLPSVLP
jgi:hypothetical protein